MIIIDESDKVLKEIKHSGSITTGLGVRDGCVEWEIFSSDKVDYYAVKCEGEEMLSGHGYTSGGIYKIIFDKRDVVDKKENAKIIYWNIVNWQMPLKKGHLCFKRSFF
ncbi:MAG: hypothetical protein IJD02_03370 [Lachnospiraceae bacterium]|nr:hypothetical protein [Lachnospiraceae bacterium]